MHSFSAEVVRKQSSSLTRTEIHDVVHDVLTKSKLELLPVSTTEGYQYPIEELELISPGISESIEYVILYMNKEYPKARARQETKEDDCNPSPARVHMNGGDVQECSIYVYVYELDSEGGEADYVEESDEDGGNSAASHHWLLPSRSFHGLWDSLIFEEEVKLKLMDYVKTAIMFATKGVNSSLVSWNNVILLHGPPGTGKTSLCKALAQKAVIRLQDDFLYGQLIEVNSHSLFSKWFSESGKLVTRMFDKILDLVEDPKSLVFLLIDEVESLAQCRQAAVLGNEPTDSIRAVNALLTQIDRIKRFPNVLILTTSNIVGSIDIAFVDRADLKLFIGHPPPIVTYGILASCINELIRVGVIKCPKRSVLPATPGDDKTNNPHVSLLFKLSGNANGLSGRSLRRLPFLTYVNCFANQNCNLSEFLKAMSTDIQREISDTSKLSSSAVSSADVQGTI